MDKYTKLSIFIENDCPCKLNFCDGKPTSYNGTKKPKCYYYIKGKCTHPLNPNYCRRIKKEREL